MTNPLFITFLRELHDSDPLLIESIESGYFAIYESFENTETEILRSSNQLLSIGDLPKLVVGCW